MKIILRYPAAGGMYNKGKVTGPPEAYTRPIFVVFVKFVRFAMKRFCGLS
jgi:hypothetical protein